MKELMIPFGLLYTVIILAIIVVPYLRRQRDLVTSFNIFLLGCANFLGMSSVSAVTSDFTLEPYYPAQFYLYYMLGVTLFTVVLLATYFSARFADAAAGRNLLAWPPVTREWLYLYVGLSCMLIPMALAPPNIPFIGQMAHQIGSYGGMFGMVFALTLVIRDVRNPFYWALFLGVLFFSLIMALYVGGTGRRHLIGVLLGIGMTVYWFRLRYLSPTKVMAFIAVFGTITFLTVAAYSSIRHRGSGEADPIRHGIALLSELPKIMLTGGGSDVMIGGDTADCSLACIFQFTAPNFEPQPFHSLYYVLTNPIPRAFWPDKPGALGIILIDDFGYKDELNFQANIGPGIVGHAYYEGGVHMVIPYAILLALVFRFLDGLLLRQPTNPFLFAMFAASAGHMLAISRGELGLFVIWAMAPFVIGFVLTVLLRPFSGRGLVYPSDLERQQSAWASYLAWQHAARAWLAQQQQPQAPTPRNP